MSGAAAYPDYFISRNGAGKTAAEQIARIIREAGLTPYSEEDDFSHADFMRMMEQGCEKAAKLIVLLSEKYQQSEHCRKEYNTFLAKDPGNLNKRVIVFRISDCAPVEMLTTLAYTDLAPVLSDREALRQTVREALGIDEQTPKSQPDILARAGQQIRHPNIREVKGFTGRDDMLDALAKKLAAKSSAAIRSQTTLAMRGVGGAGKTVLAQEYAWRNRERYCGIWWIRAEARETLMDDLVALGARFIPGVSDMKPEDAALKTVDQLAQMPTASPGSSSTTTRKALAFRASSCPPATRMCSLPRAAPTGTARRTRSLPSTRSRATPQSPISWRRRGAAMRTRRGGSRMRSIACRWRCLMRGPVAGRAIGASTSISRSCPS